MSRKPAPPLLTALDLPAPMTRNELLNALSAANLSQRGAARVLEIDERTMRYYCAGKRATPRAVQYALYYLALHHLNPTIGP